jgi:hypothetical protein
MFGGQRWIVALAGVVVPLAVVVGSLRYEGYLWPIVMLAIAASASVALVEIGARGDTGESVRESRHGDD